MERALNLSVLIPYRPRKGLRDQIFDWIMRRYDELLPGAQICIGENHDEPFSRAKARNDAFRKADCDYLLIADADTAFHPRQITQALALVEERQHWVLPYRTYYNLTQAYTATVLDLPPSVDIPEAGVEWEFQLFSSVAGLLVMPRQAFEKVGGYDERFIGWGYEDNSFQLAMDTLWAPHQRLNDYVLHLWHPPGPRFDSPTIQLCQALFLHYERANGDVQAMGRLVDNYLV